MGLTTLRRFLCLEVQVLSYGDEGGHESHQSHEGHEESHEESRRCRRCTKEGHESHEGKEGHQEGNEGQEVSTALAVVIPIDLSVLAACMYWSGYTTLA